MKQSNHTKTTRMHLTKSFTGHALSKFGLCHCKRLIPRPLSKNALPPHKYTLPSLTQHIPETDLDVFIFSDSTSSPFCSLSTYIKSHSFHSYRSITMHHSFATLIVLAVPFITAQSLLSIPSCAVNRHHPYPTNHPMLIHRLQLPAVESGIQKTGCDLSNTACICGATSLLETVKQQISSVCSAADQDSKRQQTTFPHPSLPPPAPFKNQTKD